MAIENKFSVSFDFREVIARSPKAHVRTSAGFKAEQLFQGRFKKAAADARRKAGTQIEVGSVNLDREFLVAPIPK